MAKTLIIPGPPTTRISRAQAEEKLKTHPQFPKGASYAVDEVDGRWVAAFTFEADGNPFGGGPDESAGGPPTPEGPPTDGPPIDDEGDTDSPPSDGDEKGDKKHDKGGELGEIKTMLQTLLTALGIGGDASMMPGDEVGPPGGPEIPEVPGGDIDPDKDPRDNKTHTVHERALKPGEAPPGTTPVGAPSFASVRIPEDHPWRQSIAAGEKEWTVTDYVGANESIGVIARELKALAEPYGYKVQQLNEGSAKDGSRVARARIARVG